MKYKISKNVFNRLKKVKNHDLYTNHVTTFGKIKTVSYIQGDGDDLY